MASSLASAVLTFQRGLKCSAYFLKGHSKWQNIKAIKSKMDAARSQKYSVLLNKVKRAVRHGGFDLKLNKELAAIQQEFRASGLSLDTFNNYLTKLKNKPEATHFFDVIGPSGSIFVLETETDSKSRMQQTIMKYFNKVGGFRFATESKVRQLFEEKGILHVAIMKDAKFVTLEQMEEIGIELDCEEVSLVKDNGSSYFELLCDYTKLRKIEKKLTEMGFKVEFAELQMRAKHSIRISVEDAAKVEKFYNYLQEDESVKQIFDNIEPEAEESVEAC